MYRGIRIYKSAAACMSGATGACKLSQQSFDLRKLVFRKVFDVLQELRVEFCLHPGEVLPWLSDARRSAMQAVIHRQIKEEDQAAGSEPARQGAEIVAVYDPLIFCEDLRQSGIEFRAAGSAAVRAVEYHVQVIQRQPGDIPELPCKCAFSGARAADDQYFFCR